MDDKLKKPTIDNASESKDTKDYDENYVCSAEFPEGCIENDNQKKKKK